jgi:hypothetical protein
MDGCGRVSVSVLEGGRSKPRVATGLEGDWVDFMTGNDLLSRNSCALVVVGSLRRETVDVFCPISLLRGVDGSNSCAGEGVMDVERLETEDWAEWPKRERDRRVWVIGPPLSDTGSSEDWICVRS